MGEIFKYPITESQQNQNLLDSVQYEGKEFKKAKKDQSFKKGQIVLFENRLYTVIEQAPIYVLISSISSEETNTKLRVRKKDIFYDSSVSSPEVSDFSSSKRRINSSSVKPQHRRNKRRNKGLPPSLHQKFLERYQDWVKNGTYIKGLWFDEAPETVLLFPEPSKESGWTLFSFRDREPKDRFWFYHMNTRQFIRFEKNVHYRKTEKGPPQIIWPNT